eukprot:2237869-Amphidinium_carterae.2
MGTSRGAASQMESTLGPWPPTLIRPRRARTYTLLCMFSVYSGPRDGRYRHLSARGISTSDTQEGGYPPTLRSPRAGPHS